MKLTEHGGGTRIEHGYAQGYCRILGCDWVGPERPSVVEARADANEHRSPSAPVIVGVAGKGVAS